MEELNGVTPKLNGTKNETENSGEHEGFFLHDNERDEVRELCFKQVPFWDQLEKDDLDVQLVSCAVTNRVYKVKLTHSKSHQFPLNQLILKKKTAFNPLVLDPDFQYKVAKLLGENNCGPRILGRFGDFTIQEWVEGTTKANDWFQNVSTLTALASSLAKFHKKATELAPKDWDQTPMILLRLTTWTEHLEKVIKKYNLNFDHNELANFFELFKKVLDEHVSSCRTVSNKVLFCHNDLFSLNILDFQQGVYLIDFDFSGYNYVGWEVASFFTEVTILYDTVAPPYFMSSKDYNLSKELKQLFVSVYLSQLLDRNVFPEDKLVEEFLKSVEVHLLGAHLFWMFWGIIMMDKPDNELSKPVRFDAYAALNYNLFKAQLEKLRKQNVVRY